MSREFPAMKMEMRCGDTFLVRDGEGPERTLVTCFREHGHPVIGIDAVGFGSRGPRPSLHRGQGWHWDDRCAWRDGQEPK